MKVIIYDTLHEDAKYIRIKVFMEEQHFVNEFDTIDNVAKHLVLYDNDKPVGCSRFYYEYENQCYIFGRLAILPEYRKHHLGTMILAKSEEAIKKLKGTHIALHAQQQASGFYEKQGYIKTDHTGFDEGCPHVWMYKAIMD